METEPISKTTNEKKDKALLSLEQKMITTLMYGRNHEMMGASSEKNLRGSTA